jgi:hypothetical protein
MPFGFKLGVSLTPFHEIDGPAGEKTHAGARLAEIAAPNRRARLRISRMFSH